MNVQKGDLAIVKGSRFNDGKIVRCVEFIGKQPYVEGEVDTWVVDPPLPRPGTEVSRMCWCPDSMLRPILDPGDSTIDETIQRLGTPAQKAMAELESELAKLREIARELKELSKVLER